MTSGKPFTPEMEDYIRQHRDRLFASEMAYNMSRIFGVPVTTNGIRMHLHKMRMQEGELYAEIRGESTISPGSSPARPLTTTIR